jgi:putative ABC transport system permease protein
MVEPIPGGPALTERQRMPWVNIVSPGWFGTFGVHLIQGRDFEAHDILGSQRVVILGDMFARRLFPDGHAVGQEIRTSLEGTDTSTLKVVGIVSDTVYSDLRKGLEPVMYAPVAQLADVPPFQVVSIRSAGAYPDALAHDLAAAVNRAAPQVTFTITPFADQLRASMRRERLMAMIAAFFGGLALLLAAVGLYGVTAYSVSRRRAEIGIRMALGADAHGVIRLVLGRLALVLASGVVFGVALTWWTTRLVEKMLFGLGPRDPTTLVGATAVLVAIGLVAGWLPARRASRIDPVKVLREV